MLINEIFYSLQGEGVHMGKASIFIRLSRCNLRCSFCDTEFDSGTEMTIEELRDAIASYPGRRIIWTGGEPTLQLTEETVAYFKALGYHQSIETNGTRRPPHLQPEERGDAAPAPQLPRRRGRIPLPRGKPC